MLHVTDTSDLLRIIAEGTTSETALLPNLVRTLAQALCVHTVFVAESIDSASSARMLAHWRGDQFQEAIQFSARETPCDCVLKGEIACYPTDLSGVFPVPSCVVPDCAVSFLGIPLGRQNSRAMGCLAIFDNRPMDNRLDDLMLVSIFASRAGAELERLRGEAKLRQISRFSELLRDKHSDALITLDAQRHIADLNPPAERLLNCPRESALRRPIDAFLSRRLLKVLEEFLREFQNSEEVTSSRVAYARRIELSALTDTLDDYPVEISLIATGFSDDRRLTLLVRSAVAQRGELRAVSLSS